MSQRFGTYSIRCLLFIVAFGGCSQSNQGSVSPASNVKEELSTDRESVPDATEQAKLQKLEKLRQEDKELSERLLRVTEITRPLHEEIRRLLSEEPPGWRERIKVLQQELSTYPSLKEILDEQWQKQLEIQAVLNE